MSDLVLGDVTHTPNLFLLSPIKLPFTQSHIQLVEIEMRVKIIQIRIFSYKISHVCHDLGLGGVTHKQTHAHTTSSFLPQSSLY